MGTSGGQALARSLTCSYKTPLRHEGLGTVRYLAIVRGRGLEVCG